MCEIPYGCEGKISEFKYGIFRAKVTRAARISAQVTECACAARPKHMFDKCSCSVAGGNICCFFLFVRAATSAEHSTPKKTQIENESFPYFFFWPLFFPFSDFCAVQKSECSFQSSRWQRVPQYSGSPSVLHGQCTSLVTISPVFTLLVPSAEPHAEHRRADRLASASGTACPYFLATLRSALPSFSSVNF